MIVVAGAGKNMLLEKLKQEIEMLQRNLVVLSVVAKNGPIGITKIAEETGMSIHKVRYSLRVLELEQLIRPSTHGAIVTGRAHDFIEVIDVDIDEIMQKISALKTLHASKTE